MAESAIMMPDAIEIPEAKEVPSEVASPMPAEIMRERKDDLSGDTRMSCAEETVNSDVVTMDSPEGSKETLKQPSRPKTAFFCYLDSARASIAQNDPTCLARDIPKRAGEIWRDMSEEARSPFEASAAELKSQYDASLTRFLERGGVLKRRQAKGDVECGGTVEVSPPCAVAQPTKPKTAFFCFLDAKRIQIKEEVDSKLNSVVIKRAAEKWRALSPEEKSPYEKESAELKDAYMQSKKEFISSGGVCKRQARRGKTSVARLAKGADAQISEINGASGEPTDPYGLLTPSRKRRRLPGSLLSTPKKAKLPRARVSFVARVVGTESGDVPIEKGERLMIKRGRKTNGNDSDDVAVMLVFDRVLGCHVGQLEEELSTILRPFAESHPSLRLSGSVCDQKNAVGELGKHSDTSGLNDLWIEMVLAGPIDLAKEISTFRQRVDDLRAGIVHAPQSGDSDVVAPTCESAAPNEASESPASEMEEATRGVAMPSGSGGEVSA
eukprot:TRINITY_DN1337_c0_g1_i1.p1 TRINITY_DN1337_c0_g1~~TRINITY_DN1337_c0_g1_i1.p1  ORF type:complete len:496 (-),score=96.73 TRINITY_DN1337_c0_g1_i1:247-1734(-)